MRNCVWVRYPDHLCLAFFLSESGGCDIVLLTNASHSIKIPISEQTKFARCEWLTTVHVLHSTRLIRSHPFRCGVALPKNGLGGTARESEAFNYADIINANTQLRSVPYLKRDPRTNSLRNGLGPCHTPRYIVVAHITYIRTHRFRVAQCSLSTLHPHCLICEIARKN